MNLVQDGMISFQSYTCVRDQSLIPPLNYVLKSGQGSTITKYYVLKSGERSITTTN